MPNESDKPTLRERHARETRRLILDAAYALFTNQGYPTTTISRIAQEAGVSVQTIYTVIGSKRELLMQLLQRMSAEGGNATWNEDLAALDDPRAKLRLGIEIIGTFPRDHGELLGALATAAAVEPELKQAVEFGQRQHREGCIGLVEDIAAKHGLREGLTPARGGAIMSAVSAVSVWRELHNDHGWSWDDIADWMVDTLADLLLPPSNAVHG